MHKSLNKRSFPVEAVTLHCQHLWRREMNQTLCRHNTLSTTGLTAGPCRLSGFMGQQGPCSICSSSVQAAICEHACRWGGNQNTKSCDFFMLWNCYVLITPITMTKVGSFPPIIWFCANETGLMKIRRPLFLSIAKWAENQCANQLLLLVRAQNITLLLCHPTL